MVKTMLPVQRNKDEYEFQDDNNQSVLLNSPNELDNTESKCKLLFFIKMNVCSLTYFITFFVKY